MTSFSVTTCDSEIIIYTCFDRLGQRPFDCLEPRNTKRKRNTKLKTSKNPNRHEHPLDTVNDPIGAVNVLADHQIPAYQHLNVYGSENIVAFKCSFGMALTTFVLVSLSLRMRRIDHVPSRNLVDAWSAPRPLKKGNLKNSII